MNNIQRDNVAMATHNTHDGRWAGARFNRAVLTIFVFLSAYLITVRAEAQEITTAPAASGAAQSTDVIQLNANNVAVITGTIKDADENWVLIDSGGKDMKIVLDRVNLKDEADEVFERGMSVTVEGELKGNDFGVPLVQARSITATQPSGDSNTAP